MEEAVKEGHYYDAGGISTLDIIKAKLTPEQYHGFLLGNVVKYACRLNFKQSAKDTNKLLDYARWLNEFLQLKNGEKT
jgi:hypothetical protein